MKDLMVTQSLQLNQLNAEIKMNYKDTPGNAEIERFVAKLDTLCNGSEKQVVLITSAIIGEGKSTVASRIAQASAHNRKNPTLLVDFDLRRPRLHEVFNVKRSNGVAEIFSHGMPLRVCIKRTYFKNLFLLTSGNLKQTPFELFNSQTIKEFFMAIRNSFDNVIVDSPPVIPVSDPILLAKVVDTVILVVKTGVTSKFVVKRAIDMFDDVKVNISGMILNNMKGVLPYYYDYYDYKYYENGEFNHLHDKVLR